MPLMDLNMSVILHVLKYLVELIIMKKGMFVTILLHKMMLIVPIFI